MLPAKFRAAGTALPTHFFSGILDISQFVATGSWHFRPISTHRYNLRNFVMMSRYSGSGISPLAQ